MFGCIGTNFLKVLANESEYSNIEYSISNIFLDLQHHLTESSGLAKNVSKGGTVTKNTDVSSNVTKIANFSKSIPKLWLPTNPKLRRIIQSEIDCVARSGART